MATARPSRPFVGFQHFDADTDLGRQIPDDRRSRIGLIVRKAAVPPPTHELYGKPELACVGHPGKPRQILGSKSPVLSNLFTLHRSAPSRARRLRTAVRPVTPTWPFRTPSRSLGQTAALMTTHFSTQIEGNRLTLPEVRAAIKGERMPGRERDEREVRNHFLALTAMEELSERLGSLSEEDIRRLHGLVMTGRNKPSPYRVTQNVIRDSSTSSIVYLPPEAPDVPELMRSLIEW